MSKMDQKLAALGVNAVDVGAIVADRPAAPTKTQQPRIADEVRARRAAGA